MSTDSQDRNKSTVVNDMSSTADENKDDDEDDAASLLLARLASQFGDMDLSTLQQGQDVVNRNNNANTADTASVPVESDEESSVVDPTPEELLAWQEAQFSVGQSKQEAQKELGMSGDVRKRRQALQERRHGAKDDSGNNRDVAGEEVYPCATLNGQESAFFCSANYANRAAAQQSNSLLEQLASHDPQILGGEWRRLYSSSQGDGLSFPHLMHVLQGYEGPTVTIIGTIPCSEHSLQGNTSSASCTRGTVGFYTATPWTTPSSTRSNFYGTDDCFLFTINDAEHDSSDNDDTGDTPVRVIRPKRDNCQSNYMISSCNNNTSNNTTTSINSNATGIGVGGTKSQPRLHLTERLEACRAFPSGGTFEAGELLPKGADSLYYFDVETLEVWGVGGEGWIEEALQARAQARDIRDANLRNARLVDKKQFLDDFRAGLLDGNKTLFGHVEHVAGRCDGYE